MDITHSGLTFSTALVFLKEGKRVARTGWNGKGMYIYLVPGSRFLPNRAPLDRFLPLDQEVKYLPHVDMKTADGAHVPWLCSQTDMLAEDWCLLADKDTRPAWGAPQYPETLEPSD